MDDRLEITNSYDITTNTPWQRRVLYNAMYLSGIGTYSIVPDKEAVLRELERIEPALPSALQNKSWVNDGSEFYVFNTQTTNGNKVITIPVDLVNHNIATVLTVINKKIIIHADNVRQLHQIYRLFKDHNISYTVDD